MARRYLSIETLNAFLVDYEIENSEYVLIKRWVPEYEQDILWDHTKEVRDRRRLAQKASGLLKGVSDMGTMDYSDEDKFVKRKTHPWRDLKLISKAKKRIKAAARFLGEGNAPNVSDNDSSGSAIDLDQTLDEGSIS